MVPQLLVALDYSKISTQVFQEALQLAQALGASMTLLHVLSRGEADSPALPAMPIMDYYPIYNASAMEVFEKAWEEYEKKGLTMLDAYVKEAQTANVKATPLQLEGPPGMTICDQARALGTQMIVMGRRGHSGLSELLLGSISNYVLHHSPCSVHVICAPSNRDGTPTAIPT